MSERRRLTKNMKMAGILVLVVMIVVGVYLMRTRTTSDETYQTLAVTSGDLNVTILSTGTVLPQNRLEIKAPVAGRMEKVLVKEGQKLFKGQVIAMMSSSERAALLDAARAKGDEEYKRWSEMYLATPIVAPITGTLILRNVEPGQTFTNADAIFIMSDRLIVKAQVDETDISKIKLKQQAELVLDAYPDTKINAAVDQIAFDAKTVNSVTTYLVDVLPETIPDFMRSGMTVNVIFRIEAKRNVTLVPSEALKVQDGRTLVNLQQPDGSSVVQEIQVGASDGKNTEVLSGLKVGDKVVVLETKINLNGKKSSNPFSPMGGARTPRH